MPFDLNLKEYSNIQGETHLLDDSHLRKPQFEFYHGNPKKIQAKPGPLSASLSREPVKHPSRSLKNVAGATSAVEPSPRRAATAARQPDDRTYGTRGAF